MPFIRQEEDALWQAFFTAAPERRRVFEPSSKPEVESGRSSDRHELEKALTLCRAHRAALVVANVSRLTRSVAFLSKLLAADVDIRFADLPTIEGATGRFMLHQMALR